MEQYHGTNSHFAQQISNGGISVNYGGGELGQGFYTGDLCHEAFNWAWHQYEEDNSVVKLNIDDMLFLSLDPLCLNMRATHSYRKRIRRRGQTRTFKFRVNILWAPVVGRHIPNFNQFKYESDSSQTLLNSNEVIKTIY